MGSARGKGRRQSPFDYHLLRSQGRTIGITSLMKTSMHSEPAESCSLSWVMDTFPRATALPLSESNVTLSALIVVVSNATNTEYSARGADRTEFFTEGAT